MVSEPAWGMWVRVGIMLLLSVYLVALDTIGFLKLINNKEVYDAICDGLHEIL